VKSLVFYISVLLFISFTAVAEDITLFNANGEPVAYIDDEDEDLTIYMWNGTPVAYLETADEGFNIFGFNGKHLGWYVNGIVIDHEGYAVGFIEGATTIFTKLEPAKPYKKFKPFKAFQEFVPFKPFYRNQFSNQPLSLFLRRGV